MTVFFDQVFDLGLHPEVEGRIALRVLGDEVQKIPLRHERDEATASRQVREVGDRDLDVPDNAAHAGCLLVRPLQELVQEAQLVQHLERRRVNGVAAEVPEEVSVLLQDHDVDPRPRQQEAQHHPGRTAARDAAIGFERFHFIGHDNHPLGSAAHRGTEFIPFVSRRNSFYTRWNGETE